MLADINFLTYFFGFKHPIYREVEYHELQNKVLYPQPIKEMLDNNVTFSTTESMSKCQGGDFVLEEKIKKQKGIAPKGIVNSKTCQKFSRTTIFRNICEQILLGLAYSYFCKIAPS